MANKMVKSMRGAPVHVREWWSGTGMQAGLFRLVELGASWEEAHERLQKSYERWWDRGAKGCSPLLRLSNRVHRAHILARIDAGERYSVWPCGGVSVEGSSIVTTRR